MSQSLVLAMKSVPDAGEPLPTPFEGLSKLGAHHRKGQVSIVAAASGSGKTAYATHVAVYSEHDPLTPVRGLYVSSDSDQVTVGVRIAAGILEKDCDEVEELLRSGNQEVWRLIEERTAHLHFYWEPEPSIFDIFEEVSAYAYIHGGYPEVIVVDNLINVEPDGSGAATHEQRDMVMRELQKLAKETNAHVMVLHHVVGEYENGDKPIPKSGLIDKVAKRPRLVLTIFKAAAGLMGVRVVKNSSGQMDSAGGFGCDLSWYPERSYISG